VLIIFSHDQISETPIYFKKQAFIALEKMFPAGTKIVYLFQNALYINLEPEFFNSLKKEFIIGTCDYSVDEDYGRKVFSFMKKNNQWNVHVNQCVKDGKLNYTSLLQITNVTTFKTFPDTLLFVKGCTFCCPGVWHDLFYGMNHYRVNSKAIFFDPPTKIKCSSSAEPSHLDYDSFIIPVHAKCHESKMSFTSRVLQSGAGSLTTEMENNITFRHNAFEL